MFLPLCLISEHYAPGNITIFHLERCILGVKKKKDKNEIPQDGRSRPANYLKVTHEDDKMRIVPPSEAGDLWLAGSLWTICPVV